MFNESIPGLSSWVVQRDVVPEYLGVPDLADNLHTILLPFSLKTQPQFHTWIKHTCFMELDTHPHPQGGRKGGERRFSSI